MTLEDAHRVSILNSMIRSHKDNMKKFEEVFAQKELVVQSIDTECKISAIYLTGDIKNCALEGIKAYYQGLIDRDMKELSKY